MNSRKRPRAVVTNDDGIGSEGLRVLAEASVRAGLDPVVAAPDGEASGTSAAMTATAEDGRVVTKRTELAGLTEVAAYAVQAAPGFIAFTAVRGAFGPVPRLLLSGINLGPNTGRAVLHSGTVGAAMTAVVSGVRAAAFSLDIRDPAAERHWATAALVAEQVIPVALGLAPGVVLNVNIPNVPPDRLRGIRTGTLASRGAVQTQIISAGEEYLQVTMRETGDKPEPGSDAALVAAGFASVTPVRPVSEGALSVLPWPPASAEPG